MIDYIRYTIDGTTYNLVNNGDGTWSRNLNAPSVVGLYNLLIEIGQSGMITYIDSSDPRYSLYLETINDIERSVDLISYLPEFMHDILEFKVLFGTENIELDMISNEVNKITLDSFIRTSSIEKITRLETFLGYKGEGSLEQRKSYLLALMQKGKELNEGIIKEVANTITGSECIVTFYGSDELDNPEKGFSLLRVQILSPDNSKDYRYADILRALKPLVPAHIKLFIIKYYATWADVKINYQDWNAVKSMDSWQAVKNYLPPQ